MDTVLDMAADAGLYVIARPGPYINAEVNAGGYPGWLTTTAGRARTDDPAYLGYADEWLTAIDRILARHQLTDGGGTLILYQIENEYASFVGSPTGVNYMAHLYAKVRADGIAVPIFHNDKGRNGYWTPGQFPRAGQQLPVRVRRLPLGKRSATRLGLLRTWRRQGWRERQPEHARLRGRVRRRLLRRVGWRAVAGSGVRLRARLRRPGVRADVLPHQRGQRHQAPERVHDVRRHVLGLAARVRSSTPRTTTARRSMRRASSRRRSRR